MGVPTSSRMALTTLAGISKPLALQVDAFLKDEKIASMPSSVATVGTTSTMVLGTQPERIFSQIINISDSDVDLAFGEAAVYGKGARLLANGGVYTIDWQNMWKQAVYAIAPGAFKNVSTIDGRIG